jgi:hypothetical protein
LSIFELREYDDYADWSETQESRQIGLEMAGLSPRSVAIELSGFLEWSRRNARRADAAALDAYAAFKGRGG